MNKKLLLLLIVTIALSGCVGNNATTDTFICADRGELYLHSDGTFHVNSVQTGASNGNYTIINDVMFLDYGSSGFSSMLTKNGMDYIDHDGDRWTPSHDDSS